MSLYSMSMSLKKVSSLNKGQAELSFNASLRKIHQENKDSKISLRWNNIMKEKHLIEYKNVFLLISEFVFVWFGFR